MSIVSGASYTLKSIVKRYLALVFIYISKQPDYRALSMKQLDEIRTTYGNYITKTLTVILGYVFSQKCRIRYCKGRVLRMRFQQVSDKTYYILFQTADMHWYYLQFIRSNVLWNKSFQYKDLKISVSGPSNPYIPVGDIFKLSVAAVMIHRNFSIGALTKLQFKAAMEDLYASYKTKIDTPSVNKTNIHNVMHDLAGELESVKRILSMFAADSVLLRNYYLLSIL